MSKKTISIDITVGWTDRKKVEIELKKIHQAYNKWFWYTEYQGVFKSVFTLTSADDHIGQSAMGAAINVAYGL